MKTEKQIAEIFAAGTYDHVLPRTTSPAQQSVRQVAARYSDLVKEDSYDHAKVMLLSGVSSWFVGTIMCALVYVTTGAEPSKMPAAVLTCGGAVGIATVMAVGLIFERWNLLSSTKHLSDAKTLILRIRDDLNALACAIGSPNHESLPGFSREHIIEMALEAGARMLGTRQRYLDSADEDERRASERARQELEEHHALLGRLDLQPRGGFPAYGRRFQELKAAGQLNWDVPVEPQAADATEPAAGAGSPVVKI